MWKQLRQKTFIQTVPSAATAIMQEKNNYYTGNNNQQTFSTKDLMTVNESNYTKHVR